MDAQQKQSMIKHISQKIFINKVSQMDINTPKLLEPEFDKIFDFAIYAAETFVEDLEINIQHNIIKEDTDETDFLT